MYKANGHDVTRSAECDRRARCGRVRASQFKCAHVYECMRVRAHSMVAGATDEYA